MRRFRLPAPLVEELHDRLGSRPPADAEGVDALYRAFCATFPFDPIMKSVALREGSTPPGADAVEVAERFLSTGVGGTCWAGCGVLAAMLADAGIDARLSVERMLDVPMVDFHCFVVVDGLAAPDGHEAPDGAGGQVRVALDVVHVSGGRLPLRAGARGTHPFYRASVEADPDHDTRLEHHWQGPDHGGRYAILSTDLDVDDVAAFCAVSVQHTGVRAARLFQRTVSASGMRMTRPTADGGGLQVRTWPGTGGAPVVEEATDDEEVAAALRLSPEGLDLLVRSGLARHDDGWTFAV